MCRNLCLLQWPTLCKCFQLGSHYICVLYTLLRCSVHFVSRTLNGWSLLKLIYIKRLFLEFRGVCSGSTVNPFTVLSGHPLYHFTVFLKLRGVCSGSTVNPFTVLSGHPLYHFTVFLKFRGVCSGSTVKPFTVLSGHPLCHFTVFLKFRSSDI